MRETLERLDRDFQAELTAAALDERAIEAVRVRYLGRKGELTGLMKQLGGLSSRQRPAAGKAINELKQQVLSSIERALEQARPSGNASSSPTARWTSAFLPAGPGAARCTP